MRINRSSERQATQNLEMEVALMGGEPRLKERQDSHPRGMVATSQNLCTNSNQQEQRRVDVCSAFDSQVLIECISTRLSVGSHHADVSKCTLCSAWLPRPMPEGDRHRTNSRRHPMRMLFAAQKQANDFTARLEA